MTLHHHSFCSSRSQLLLQSAVLQAAGKLFRRKKIAVIVLLSATQCSSVSLWHRSHFHNPHCQHCRDNDSCVMEGNYFSRQSKQIEKCLSHPVLLDMNIRESDGNTCPQNVWQLLNGTYLCCSLFVKAIQKKKKIRKLQCCFSVKVAPRKI